MSQVSRRRLSESIEKQICELFLRALCTIRTSNQADAFIVDFFTPAERVFLPKRLSIAYMLAKGYDHRTIADTLKVSFTTISRINIAMNTNGRGYKAVISYIVNAKKTKEALGDLDAALSLLVGPGGKHIETKIATYKQKKRQAKTAF